MIYNAGTLRTVKKPNDSGFESDLNRSKEANDSRNGVNVQEEEKVQSEKEEKVQRPHPSRGGQNSLMHLCRRFMMILVSMPVSWFEYFFPKELKIHWGGEVSIYLKKRLFWEFCTRFGVLDRTPPYFFENSDSYPLSSFGSRSIHRYHQIFWIEDPTNGNKSNNSSFSIIFVQKHRPYPLQ